MMPALLPFARRQGFGPLAAGLSSPPIFLTTASGFWTPPPELQRARLVFIVTGPGGSGIAGSSSGGAGGTAIGLIDLATLSGEPISFTVGQAGTNDPSAILGLQGNAGSSVSPAGGSASGGLLQIPGGTGFELPVTSVTPSTNYTPGHVVDPTGNGGVYDVVGSSVSVSVSVSRGGAPGGASYWGGSNGFGTNATVPGAGGYASEGGYWLGARGIIAIMGG